MASVLFAVRAEVPEAERARFDHWYETDHLPWAKREFGARRAWRCWSRSDPGVHVAFYEFDSLAAAEAATSSEKVKPLVADFDRVWGDRVPRRRAILEIVQEFASYRLGRRCATYLPAPLIGQCGASGRSLPSASHSAKRRPPSAGNRSSS